MPNTSVQGSRGPGALLGLAGPWNGVRVDKSGPQWPGAEPWMCWMERASMLRKLTKTAVLTGGSVGRGAMEHSKALSPMAAGREQNRDRSYFFISLLLKDAFCLFLLFAVAGLFCIFLLLLRTGLM